MRVFGLEVQSTIALPDLLPERAPAGHPIALTIVQHRPSEERGRLHFEQCPIHAGLRVLECSDGSFEFWFADGMWARVAHDGSSIDAYSEPGSTLEDALSYVYGVLMGFALRLRGVLALHASAVLVDGWAVAFAGPSGSGKSTTAAALVAAGGTALTDDVTALEQSEGGGFVVHAGNPYLKIWPDSASLLATGPLSELSPTWPKLRVPTSLPPPVAPLAAVCILEGPAGSRGNPLEVAGAEAVIAFAGVSFLSHLLRPRDRAAELVSLGILARHVKLFRISPPVLPAELRAFRDTVGEIVMNAVRGE